MRLILLVFITLISIFRPLFSEDEVPYSVYGKDDRIDLYAAKNPLVIRAERAVAAMVVDYRLENGQLIGTDFSNKVCQGARFSNQVSIAKCTGFIVGPKTLITAGHCVKGEDFCQKFKWVFGFNQNSPNQKRYNAPKENIYHCKNVLERKFSGFGAIDYAVIELDRAVSNREPLEFRTEGKLLSEDKLILMGYASGLPLKIVEGGNILKNDHLTFFETDLDSFGGNSGSPVINARTGIVEGIQTRGHAAYVRAPGKLCKIPKVCRPGECHTAKAVRITVVGPIQ